MSSLNELLQKYVNMSYEELLDMAKFSLSQFIGTIMEDGGQDGTAKVLAIMTSACFGADYKFTALENKFLNDLTDSNDSYAENLEMVRALGNDEARQFVDDLLDSLTSEEKAAAASFCLCLLAVDETVTRDEIAFFDRLLG